MGNNTPKTIKNVQKTVRCHSSKSWPAGGQHPLHSMLGESKKHRNHQPRNRQTSKRDVIFQNPDPPEATCMLIPYLGRPKWDGRLQKMWICDFHRNNSICPTNISITKKTNHCKSVLKSFKINKCLFHKIWHVLSEKCQKLKENSNFDNQSSRFRRKADNSIIQLRSFLVLVLGSGVL